MKKISMIAFIVMILLTSCTTKDKNIVLSEDTSGDINSKYEVKVETISERFKDDEIANPVFYDNDSLYFLKGKLNNDRSKLVTEEMVKFNLDSSNMEGIRNIDIDLSGHSNEMYTNSRYYIGPQSNTGGLSIIKDNLSDMEYEISEREFDKEISEHYKDGEIMYEDSTSNIMENKEGYYLSSRVSYGEILSNSKNGYVKNYSDIKLSQIDLYDFVSNKKYSYTACKHCGDKDIMTKIDFSNKLNKYFGFNEVGDVFELDFEGDRIKTRLVYKLPLNDGEFIEFNRIFTNTIISNNKVLYSIYTGDSAMQDQKAEYTKKYQEVKILDLVQLTQSDFDIKLSDTNMNIFKTLSDLVLINTNNEYALVDISQKQAEIVYKFTLNENQHVTSIISNSEGNNVAISIIEVKVTEEIDNTNMPAVKYLESELLQLTINKFL